MANNCKTCGDTGECPTCGGTKVMPKVGRPFADFNGIDVIPCATCFGVGECPICRGRRIQAPNAPRLSRINQPSAVA
jgi:hypothetical protein